MTVKELIERLSGMDPDLPVTIGTPAGELAVGLMGAMLESESRPYKTSYKRGEYKYEEHVVLVSY